MERGVKPGFKPSRSHFQEICMACARERPADAPPLQRCSRCLMAHYCDRECQKRDWATHKAACPNMALTGFKMMMDETAGGGQNMNRFAVDTLDFVLDNGRLPVRLTLKQVDDLVAHARVAIPHLNQETQSIYHSLLALSGACARAMQREPKKVEAFIAAAEAMLAGLPANSPHWVAPGVVYTCLQLGNVYCLVGRATDAVAMGRRVKPIMEAAVASDVPGHNLAMAQMKEQKIRGLLLLLKDYAMWLTKCGSKHPSRHEALASAEHKEAEALQRQSIDMAQSINIEPHMLVDLYVDLLTSLAFRGAYDQLFKLAQKAMKLPPSLRYGTVVYLAVDALLNLKKDTQAESLIVETLSKSKREPRLLSPLDHAILLHFQGLSLCRRGACAEALVPLRRAREVGEGFVPRTEAERRSVQTQLIETKVQIVEALERLGRKAEAERIEATLGADAMRRPAFLVKDARRRVAGGAKATALAMLRDYADSYAKGGYEWKTRTRGVEGDEFKPLELLRDMLEEGSEERAQIVELIDSTRRQDEALRQQALEDLQKEMRGGRQVGGRRKKEGEAKGPSKASKKKKKKRDKKKQQHQQSDGQEEQQGAGAPLELTDLTLQDEEPKTEPSDVDKPAADVAGKEEDWPDECPLCLRSFDGDDEDDDEEEDFTGEPELLGCGHRFHDVCIDRWLSKCAEKGLLSTCPICRRDVVRVAAADVRGGKRR